MSNEFEPITTQEQFDQAIKARIERAQAKVAERFADYDELKAKAEEYDRAREASKTELQRAQDKAAKAEAELRELKDAQERSKAVSAAASSHGVPAELLSRMAGDPDENAELLAKSLGGKAYPQTRDNGDAGHAGKADPCAEAARMMFGRK